MKYMMTLLLAAGMLTGASAADENVLKTHAEIGYTNTAGNTVSEDVAGNLKLSYAFGKNEFRFVGNALYSKNRDNDTNITATTKNRWDAELNYDYNFNKRWAFNYLVGGKGDKFSTYVYQAYTGPGAIWKAIKSDSNDLKFQGNLLWSWDDHREPLSPGSSETMDDYASWQVSLDYTYTITETSKFIQYLMYRSDFSDSTNYFAKSKTALESKINSMLSLGVSYTVDYTNDKADNVRSYTDRVFLAALIADF